MSQIYISIPDSYPELQTNIQFLLTWFLFLDN